jgi:hypothetical protein
MRPIIGGRHHRIQDGIVCYLVILKLLSINVPINGKEQEQQKGLWPILW